jgi:hypothetical protein
MSSLSVVSNRSGKQKRLKPSQNLIEISGNAGLEVRRCHERKYSKGGLPVSLCTIVEGLPLKA